MTPNEIAQIIILARRAPLQNMAEAEAAAQLLHKLTAEYAPKKSAEVAEAAQAGADQA